MVIVSSKDKPVWQMVLVAFFFTIAIFLITVLFKTFQFTINESILNSDIKLVGAILIVFIGGISFSQKNTLFFDLENKKFKDQFSVGPFKLGKWQDLPSLKYISIFGVDSKYYFQINLWYGRNQYINIFTANNKERAFETGFKIANQLNIKLLDATKRNNYKYLDMDKLKEKYKSD